MANETNSINAAAYTANGTARDKVALPADLFDGTVNMPVLHQAVKAFLANRRQGNAKTKTRGLVEGGNQKPWKQKGTGRARQGSIRAPNWVGGGTVFGPIPRSYAQYVPRQVRALARKSALNARAREGAVMVVDKFSYDHPQTSRMASMIGRLELSEKKVLVLTDGVNENVYLSGRNMPKVQVLPYSDVSAYHVLWSDAVIIEAAAIGHTLAPVADTEVAPKTKKAGAAAKAAKAPKAAKAEKKTTAARKPAAKAAKKTPKKPVAKKAAKAKAAAKPKKKKGS
jgi:large subunit ribosomal protein L4